MGLKKKNKSEKDSRKKKGGPANTSLRTNPDDATNPCAQKKKKSGNCTKDKTAARKKTPIVFLGKRKS